MGTAGQKSRSVTYGNSNHASKPATPRNAASRVSWAQFIRGSSDSARKLKLLQSHQLQERKKPKYEDLGFGEGGQSRVLFTLVFVFVDRRLGFGLFLPAELVDDFLVLAIGCAVFAGALKGEGIACTKFR